MSIMSFTTARSRSPAAAALPSAMARALFVLLILAAATVGVLSTDAGTAHAAAAAAGADLTRLLRLMMLVKGALVAAAVGATLWRLGSPASPVRFAAYALAGGTMVAGPGLIWGMAHVGLGALLMHAGLAATIVLLWRDPAVSGAMDAVLKRRGVYAKAPPGRRAPAGD